MKTLILARHAKSSWADAGLRDIERPLNARGLRDAPVMGKRLEARGVLPELIVSSPAVRARHTAELIAAELDPAPPIRLDERIYGARTQDIATIVWGLDDRFGAIMLFGHNPTFTDFVNDVAGSAIDNMPTCSIATLRFAVNLWVDAHVAELIEFDYPKKSSGV